MIIGIPKECKNHEYRVGASPAMVQTLIEHGHTVICERNCGAAIGFTDALYEQKGARIAGSIEEVYGNAQLIVKVKEPQPKELELLQKDQVLFCYLHLAPDPYQTKKLLEKQCVAIAYETVIDAQGKLPLLTPMSEIAGRISIQAGAFCLHMANGGKGVLLGGAPGVLPGNVVIIGGGVVGTQAAKMAMGLGADVTLLDTNLVRLKELDELYGPRLKTLFSSSTALEELLPTADLVVGAVLVPGKTAPCVIKRHHLEAMQPGSVVVDVSIDQGGCMESSKPTTHAAPTYIEGGIVHYCVTNMPGACAKSATIALTNATMPYVLKLANQGYQKALKSDPLFREGLNVCHGYITNQPVALDLGYEYVRPLDVL